MATRRIRIKGVLKIPPRRINNNADKEQNKDPLLQPETEESETSTSINNQGTGERREEQQQQRGGGEEEEEDVSLSSTSSSTNSSNNSSATSQEQTNIVSINNEQKIVAMETNDNENDISKKDEEEKQTTIQITIQNNNTLDLGDKNDLCNSNVVTTNEDRLNVDVDVNRENDKVEDKDADDEKEKKKRQPLTLVIGGDKEFECSLPAGGGLGGGGGSACSSSSASGPLHSPSKIINWRKRAIPKFGCSSASAHQRRISFSIHGSASESEDDSKRSSTQNTPQQAQQQQQQQQQQNPISFVAGAGGQNNYSRVRNDSVCSVASVASTHVSQASLACEDSESGIGGAKSTKSTLSSVEKKARRSGSRRMIEARREFLSKCEGGKPDRQKLTMLDLIFYNPTTNPMSEKKKKKPVNSETSSISGDSIKSSQSTLIDETIDDPTPSTTINNEYKEEEEEEENSMPVPQIKIGPNGEIIVDEKSLVIENQSTKINRHLLQSSEIVDGDLDSGFGYKRTKRPKEWTRSETIRFYNALNSIGTDFMLMCELFPKRTRRELKQKFKKEERLNRQLIDKALTQPRQFDMEDLHKELEAELEELKRLEKLEEEKKKFKEARANMKVTRKRGIEMENSIENIEPPNKQAKKVNQESRKKKKRMVKRKTKNKSTSDFIKGGILSVLNDDDSDEDLNVNVNKTTGKRKRNGGFLNKQDSEEGDLNFNASCEDSGDENDEEEEEEEQEIVNISCKATRSGRLSKPRAVESPSIHDDIIARKPSNYNLINLRKKKAVLPLPDDEEDDNNDDDKMQEEDNKNEEKGQETNDNNNKENEEEGGVKENLEPGSIMIVSSIGPEGETTYKVFMVTSDQGRTQIELGHDVIKNLTQAANDNNSGGDATTTTAGAETAKGQIKTPLFAAENILTITTSTQQLQEDEGEAEEVEEENNVTIPEDKDIDLRPQIPNLIPIKQD